MVYKYGTKRHVFIKKKSRGATPGVACQYAPSRAGGLFRPKDGGGGKRKKKNSDGIQSVKYSD